MSESHNNTTSQKLGIYVSQSTFINAVITLLSKLMVEYINILDGPRGVELTIFYEPWRQLTEPSFHSCCCSVETEMKILLCECTL